MSRGALAVLSASLLALGAGCGRSRHAHIAAYTPPPLQAGFEERSGAGWRLAVPSTWREAARGSTAPPVLSVIADPQVAAEGFHAKVNVLAEGFAGESYEYARSNEAALRREPRAKVEAVREDVVDGDPTLLIESHWTAAPPSTVAYRTMQSTLASRGAGYVVTCSVAASAFERYRSTCEAIVRSFAVER